MLVRGLSWVMRIGLALALLGQPLAAQEGPDLTKLPVVTAPGAVAAAALPDQGFWLQVGRLGLYRLALDGPGLIGLTLFDTPDGRSDGSAAQNRLVQSGSAYDLGVLDDLLLMPGRAYLMQIAATTPRGVTLTLTQPLEAAAALTLADLAAHGPDAPLPLTAGRSYLVQPDGTADLSVAGPQAPSDALRIAVLMPPGAAVTADFAGQAIGPGGIYPVRPFDIADLRLDGQAGPDGKLPFAILRADPIPASARYDETEPGDTDLGALTAQGRAIRGALLAPDDRDIYDLVLDQPATFDLIAQVQGDAPAYLRLSRDDTAVLENDMADGQMFRQGLTLPAGHYRLEISAHLPQPADYEVTLRPAAPDATGEPDDRPELARQIADGQAVRGILAEDNPGFVRFDVGAVGHLWELRAVQGLRDLQLTDGNGASIGGWDTPTGALALRLSLPPGQYTAQLRGDGPYALRLRDLGPAPVGTELEPNDSDASPNRMAPDTQVTGDFQTLRDQDAYEMNLPAPTPLTITVSGPDDGASVVDLLLADGQTLRAELPAGATGISYSALFPAGRQIITWRPRDEGVSGRYTMQIARTALPEADEPSGVAALPGDGLVRGHIGGFDGEDRIFVALPQGSGTMALACQGALRDWEVLTYGDEVRLARGAVGEVLVLPYGPDTGGAVGLWVGGGDAPGGDYDCRVRFAPAGATLPAVIPIPHDEAADAADVPTVLAAGAAVSGVFDTDRDRDLLRIGLAPGQFAGLSCDVALKQMRADRTVEHALNAAPLTDDPALPFLAPFLAAPDPEQLELNPLDQGPFPRPWTCRLLAEADFRTPAQMGPAAVFTGHSEPGDEPAAFNPQATLRLLAAGRPDWLSPRQITADLAATLSVTGLETPFRAFDRLGQTADLTVSATNTSDSAVTVDLDIAALADGWRVTPGQVSLTLPAGETAAATVTLTLPPMQSPVIDPQVFVTARAAGKRTAASFAVALDAAAAERGAHRFWTAPDALRGGLNPMQYQLGARLITLDGAPVTDEEAADWAFLHDGAALHTGIPHLLRAHSAVFQLAAPAPVAGVVVDLRTTEPRGTWPAQLGLELSDDGVAWQEMVVLDLTASDLPQIFARATVTQARFARVTLLGCRADPTCDGVALSDVGLIAPPDWRMPQPLDLADPELGGHVVWAGRLGATDPDEGAIGGPWNVDLLTEGRASAWEPASEDRGDKVQAVIGFAGARAGRIAALEWLGTVDDVTRPTGARIEASIAGPGGPWQDIGTLPAPPAGTLTARLTLPTPVWARAIRLTFDRDATDKRALPDRIRIYEDQAAPPLLGLWEDDRPDAGYEATVLAAPVTAPPPIGGADAAQAVSLPLGRAIASSVQLERNQDWWRIDIPQGPPQRLSLRFALAAHPEFTLHLTGPDGTDLPYQRTADAAGDLIVTANALPGTTLVQIEEPPRSVAILWDTSGSVGAFVPGILESVRLWSQSLRPGRDLLQLLPFGQDQMLLDDWAGTPEQIYPVLGHLPAADSSDSESALGVAATALAAQDGQRGIVIITDAETGQASTVWGPLLQAQPRIVALSIDSGDAQGVAIMKDWASLNGGLFTRVTGNAGLADGLDLAAALFRAPKGYVMTATTEVLREPTGAGSLTLTTPPGSPDAPLQAQPTGGIEVILDASGSMLKRMADGQRRIAVAHDALAGLVRDTLPEGTNFAFRAFGLAADACDQQLIVPLGPLDRAVAEAAIRDVPAINNARTAIAASLALAAQDLADVAPPRAVVLVTDGEETCDGDVGAEVARLRAAGLDLRLTIVGFAIDDAALAANFTAWAGQSGGQYLTAGDSAGLAASITAAIAPRFAIDRLYVDGTVAEVGQIGLDQTQDLPAGQYRLRPLQTAQGAAMTFNIENGAALGIDYDPTLGLIERDPE